MKLESLTDVFHHELMDLYSAEKQLTKALPTVAKAVSGERLREALEEHQRQTEEHVRRLDEVASQLDVRIKGETCEAMEGLIEEAENLLDDNDPGDALDAALIAAAQRIEHYEIAAYGSASTFARRLGHDTAEQLLSETLREEREADEKLTTIAEGSVNEAAVQE